MSSSGIRRGLAVLAVGAMAVLALPGTAFANPIDSQMDNAWTNKHVTLYGPHPGTNQISIKNDGQNSTVRLEAGGTSDIDTMRFQYSTDAGVTWVNIGGVMTTPNDDGAWSMEWNPLTDSGIPLGTVGLQVRANGHSNLDGLSHPGTGIPVTFTNTQDTINVTDGNQLGVWHSAASTDLVIVKGTASYNGTGTLGIGEPVTGTRVNVQSGITIASNAWKTVYNLKPDYASAPFGYNAPDQVVLSATTSNANPTSGDTESFTLYNQVIDHINVSHPTPPDNTTTVPVTLTVVDQNGNPIAGVNVSDQVDDFPGPFAAQTTDVNGQVTFNQKVNDGGVQYIANAGSGDQFLFNPGLGDKDTTVQLEAGHATSLVGTSADGPAFDFDEQDGNDVQVQVKDQNSANLDVPNTQDLTYHWTKTPFFFNETIAGTSHTVTTETNGLFDIPVLTGSDFTFGLEPGTYKLFASLSEGGTGHPVAEQQVLSVKVGEARVTASDAVVPAGSTASVPSKLALEDGTGLPGRKVNVVVHLGTEYNEHGVPTGTPDAVLVSNTPDTTDASGNFTAKVEDLSHDPNQPELGDSLTFTSAVSSFGTWNGGAVSDSPSINFVSTSAPAGSKLNIEYGAGGPANINDLGDADASGPAGSAQSGGLLLVDSANDPLVGVAVTLTLDHGFFVPATGSINKAPAQGDYNPTPNSLGTTIQVVTGPTGRAAFKTSIGRDTGFDDDGHVTAKVTGTISAATDSDTNDWNSGTVLTPPLNVSEVTVVKTPEAHQTNPTDPAPVNNPVLFDVFAKDQFGNPANGVHVAITCNPSSDASCPALGLPPAGLPANSDLDNGGDFTITSSQAGDFDLTATVDNVTTRKYNAALASEVQTVKTDFSQEWYAVDFANSQFTIAADPGTTDVPTDAPVTVTVTATDQKGNPIAGLHVQFVRTSDADNDQTFDTDANGVAQYVFQGTANQCGTQDTVTAVTRNGSTIVKQQNITIQFASCAKGDIVAHLLGKDNGAKDDELTVEAPAAAQNAVVKLFKFKDGERRLIDTKSLSEAGLVKFKVADENGKSKTKYIAKVKATDATNAAETNTKKVR